MYYMKKASIISIGNEIITGHIVDTNAAYLSGMLITVGIPTVGVQQVGDEINLMVRAMRQAAEVSDVIIITGGLGPTDDDITREAVAKYLGAPLELRADLLNYIAAFFDRRGIAMPQINKRQAYIPAGAEPLENPLGTAPGIIARQDGKIIAVMPGVPSEMKRMFEESVLPQLREFSGGQIILVRKLKCFGVGESVLAQMLGDMMDRGRNPQINCTVSFGVITLHIIASAADSSQAQQMVEKDEMHLRDILGEFVYGEGGQTLGEAAGRLLVQQKKTLAIAESCTGGLAAKLITDAQGSSRYFKAGWITYSNEAKTAELGVPAAMILQYGAVSEPVAAAMAKGARHRAGADFALSITGIAGPDGGSEQKPVGLVYIGVASADDCCVNKYVFSHDREFIRLRAAQTALNLLRLKMLI